MEKKNTIKRSIQHDEEIFSIDLAAQTNQKRKSHTTKSCLMQDWVFRLGEKPRMKIAQKLGINRIFLS